MGSSIWAVAGGALVLNLPFGYLRSGLRRFSAGWFLAVHVPVPFVILLRLLLGVSWHPLILLLMVGTSCLGQLLGGRLRGGSGPSGPAAPGGEG